MLVTLGSFRRRRITMGIGLFVAVSLISTGFATFVISSQSTGDGSGNIQVGTVSDKVMTITIDNKDNLGSFILDTKKIDDRGAVYCNSNSDTDEKLSITITGNISSYDYLRTLNIKLVETEPNDTFIKTAIDAGYINEPKEYGTGYNFSSDEITSIKNAKGIFSYTINLSWGSKFNYLNPGFYYDNEIYENGKWVTITENQFTGSKEEIISTLVDLRRTFHNVPEEVTDEEYYENQNKYEAKKYKIVITASAS